MKIKLALVSLLMAFGVSTAQATPDILSTVSSDSVEKISTVDAAKVRGEYFVCGKIGYCGVKWSKTKMTSGNGTYVRYLFKVRKYGWWGPVKYYVAR